VFVVSVGALVPLKGFDVVIRAFHLLHERGVDAHLGIVGQGPERAHLEALAQELGVGGRVHFLGAQSNVGAIFRDAADVIAIGSRVESFGLVAAEAGAVGRPIVATRVGGLVEVIEQGKTALLVPSGDYIAFADALDRLARDPLLRRELGAAARNHILTHFTAEQAVLRFEQLYIELTARPAASFGWFGLGFRIAPFARLGLAVVGRRLGARIADA
jgi:glycosyltransferase involved in cell wall biosynthesis